MRFSVQVGAIAAQVAQGGLLALKRRGAECSLRLEVASDGSRAVPSCLQLFQNRQCQPVLREIGGSLASNHIFQGGEGDRHAVQLHN